MLPLAAENLEKKSELENKVEDCRPYISFDL